MYKVNNVVRSIDMAPNYISDLFVPLTSRPSRYSLSVLLWSTWCSLSQTIHLFVLSAVLVQQFGTASRRNISETHHYHLIFYAIS